MEKEMNEGDRNLKMKLLFAGDTSINKSNEFVNSCYFTSRKSSHVVFRLKIDNLRLNYSFQRGPSLPSSS